MKHSLNTLIEQTPLPLMRVKSAFPFLLFPTYLIIDTLRVSVVEKHFPLGSTTQTIPVKDVSSVVVVEAYPFASLKILPKFPANDPIVVSRLKSQDAVKAQQIIDGLIIADREQIDLVEKRQPNISETLEELGAVPSVNTA